MSFDPWGAQELLRASDLAGPPWILGDRGLALEAPENTLSSFERALAAGADGIHYDLRAAADLEPVVIRDMTLERTAGLNRRPEDLSMPELSQLDAGGWFSKDFVGEPIPFLDEVLELSDTKGASALHFVELHGGALIGELERHLGGHQAPLSLRVASTRRDHCLELQEAGMDAVWMVPRAGEAELAFVRDHRLTGIAVTTNSGWQAEVAESSWPCERWMVGVDRADDLLRALGSGMQGVSTNEVRRARALRALLALTGGASLEHPIEVDELPVGPRLSDACGGEWRGEWKPSVRLRNPFGWSVRAQVDFFVRRGAFDVQGLPVQLELQAGEAHSLDVDIRGGSWSPGGDPLLAVLFEWDRGPGREAGQLLLDRTLRRTRRVLADGVTQRVEMLRESPGVPAASMTLTRRKGLLSVGVENRGGLRELCSAVHLDGETFTGGERLRVALPPDFDRREGGVPFSCGFWGEGPRGGARVLRRWCGGLPRGPESGGPGRLLPRPRA